MAKSEMRMMRGMDAMHLSLHNVGTLSAKTSLGVSGAFKLVVTDDGYETHEFVFFLGDEELAQRLANAINDAVAQPTLVEKLDFLEAVSA